MRRRIAAGASRHELMDAKRWARCDRWDGGTQPCLCWFAGQQSELTDAGTWPGGVVAALSDYVELTQIHDCNVPFDYSKI